MPPAQSTELDDLLERESELGLLLGRLERTRAGEGGIVLVEGAAGVGKTTLLRRLRAEARAAAPAMRMLQAVGGELEREFPFGLVRQLFEPLVLGAPEEQRERLLSGAAALAAPVVGAAPQPAERSADASFATLHGLYWLVAALAEEEPLLLCIDDAHWGDDASLRFIDFLARRAPELPVLIAVGLRPSEVEGDRPLLTALADAPGAESVRPGALSREAVGRVLAATLTGVPADEDVIATAHDSTGGNPLLLRELIRTLTADRGPVSADAIRSAVPSSVARSVSRRLARLPDAAGAVARALAVLGDRHQQPPLAEATGLGEDELRRGMSALVGAEILEGAPPRFVHPMLREAVAGGVDALERDALHHRAASALHGRPDREDETVLHLLASSPRGESWVAPLMRRAARRALDEGAPEAAVTRLRRALEERTDAGNLGELLVELGTAEMTIGDPAALGHLAAAARDPDPGVAARAEAGRAVLLAAGDPSASADVLARAIQLIGDRDPEWVAELRGSLLIELSLAPDRARGRNDMIAAIEADPPPPVLAQLAWAAANTNVPAPRVHDLARRALAGHPLRRLDLIERSVFFAPVFAQIWTDVADESDDALREAEATSRLHGSRLASMFTATVRASWELAYGSAAAAEAALREPLGMFGEMGLTLSRNYNSIVLADALVLQGRLAEAEALLASLGTDDQLDGDPGGWERRLSRGRLRLAQGRPADAVADLRVMRELSQARQWERYGFGHGESLLAMALAAAGEREEALAAADREVELARAAGRTTTETLAIVARARALDGDAAIETLAAAVGVGRRSPVRSVLAGALLDHGSALRRSGRRADAREPLREARDLAHRAGAAALETAATEELVVAGGRPRRVATSGLEALTPSERRVADHAAGGMSNREIAEALFVTRKTVESQLGSVYAKLGIQSRVQLAERLASNS